LKTFDPYEWLARSPAATLEISRLPDDEMGCWIPEQDTIILDDRLSQTERRCTLVHELVHRLHQDDPDLPPELAHFQEEACKAQAARLLIPMPALLDALLWSWAQREAEMADHLWVDVDTLRDRMKHLTNDERKFLLDKIREAREDVA
jgi:Zn-dependent peptidase ImmA (M78 family)